MSRAGHRFKPRPAALAAGFSVEERPPGTTEQACKMPRAECRVVRRSVVTMLVRFPNIAHEAAGLSRARRSARPSWGRDATAMRDVPTATPRRKEQGRRSYGNAAVVPAKAGTQIPERWI